MTHHNYCPECGDKDFAPLDDYLGHDPLHGDVFEMWCPVCEKVWWETITDGGMTYRYEEKPEASK